MLDGRPEAAERDAVAAAASAEVEVDEVAQEDVGDVGQLIADVWGPEQSPQDNLTRALIDAGTGMLVAARDGRPIGVSLGFLGWSDGLHLHSHMTAVVPGARSHGVGFALKLWQRYLCLANGIDEVRWTYDPLVARNAYFNLVKLGASVRRFSPDHYGEMDDLINAGDNSDRFEVSWQLDSALVARALRREMTPLHAAQRVVEIPEDYESLRANRPVDADRVRRATREAFARYQAEGHVPTWSNEPRGYSYRLDTT